MENLLLMSNISYLAGSKNWNPISGCQKISPACKYCWAETMTKRFHPNQKFSDIRLLWNKLDEPLSWKKPQIVATCFTTDLFQKDVPDEFLHQVFEIIRKTPQHKYVFLTKRSERLVNFFNRAYCQRYDIDLLTCWFGVTVENSDYIQRVYDLLEIPIITNRWLSMEPLLGPVRLNKDFIKLNWIVVGGESGTKARFMNPEWVYPVRDFCHQNYIPFYFKQWGKQEKGYLLDNQEYQMNPIKEENIRFPKTAYRNFSFPLQLELAL